MIKRLVTAIHTLLWTDGLHGSYWSTEVFPEYVEGNY